MARKAFNARNVHRDFSMDVELSEGMAYYMGDGTYVLNQVDESDGSVHRSIIRLEGLQLLLAKLAQASALSGNTSHCALELARAA